MGKLNVLFAQQATDLPRKATPRLIGRALHEEDHLRLVHQSVQARIELLLTLLFLHRWGRRRGGLV